MSANFIRLGREEGRKRTKKGLLIFPYSEFQTQSLNWGLCTEEGLGRGAV